MEFCVCPFHNLTKEILLLLYNIINFIHYFYQLLELNRLELTDTNQKEEAASEKPSSENKKYSDDNNIAKSKKPRLDSGILYPSIMYD